MPGKGIFSLAMVLAGVLLVGGCAPSGPPPATERRGEAGTSAATAVPAGASASVTVAPVAEPPAAAAPVTLRAGVLGVLAEAGIYIALDRGYFTEEGIVPELVTIDTGARGIPALATGQFHMSGGGFSPAFVNAALRGVGIKMVVGLSRNEVDGNSGWTVVRKDLYDRGVIREWPDLRGRTVAVPSRGSVNDYVLERSLQLHGASLADLNLVELSFPDMVPALANQNVDAAYLTEPLATLAADRGISVRWKSTGEDLPGTTPALLSYAPTFVDEHPELARRWMVAYLRGARDYNTAFKRGEGRADVVRILTTHTTVKDPALYDRIGMSTIDPDGTLNVASLADQMAWYGEQGLLQGSIDLNALIDNRWREAAVARLGPYRP
jgi:NitT/TauT family transport system substrate-binding protein